MENIKKEIVVDDFNFKIQNESMAFFYNNKDTISGTIDAKSMEKEYNIQFDQDFDEDKSDELSELISNKANEQKLFWETYWECHEPISIPEEQDILDNLIYMGYSVEKIRAVLPEYERFRKQ